ncbi:hypothetical protein T484DRAFT_1868370, partial [Baffinella frigidus]
MTNFARSALVKPVVVNNFARSALVKPVVVNVGRAGATNLDVVQARFSATFRALVKPVVVNVGRAGATNVDVEVEYVKQEARIVYLLECLQKTAPPCLIFCENKADVDDIHEYLLIKGVDA